MHMHTIQLSTMRCVCIISVLFVFEKILMFCKSYPHNRSIVCLCVCLNSLILWSTALYSSMAAVSSSLLFYCSLPPPVLLSHRLTSVFISCLLSSFPVPSVGVCVRVMLCVSDSAWVLYTSAVCRPIKPVQTLWTVSAVPTGSPAH